MSKSRIDVEGESRPDVPGEKPGEVHDRLSFKDRLSEAARSLSRIAKGRQKSLRMRESGAEPRVFSGWLGRFRRKRS